MDFVPAGCFPADIGSDHAWLPIHLVSSGKVNYAMAIDNKMGPYLRMKGNVEEAGLGNRIVTLLSDGIKDIRPDVDCLILCGIGGLLACEILESHPEKLTNIQTIVVDPHRDLVAVRKRVSELGYHIADEEMVLEDHVYYSIIRFEKGAPKKPYTNNELAFGPKLMEKNTSVYRDWLSDLKKKLGKLLNEKLSKQRRDIYLQTYRAVASELGEDPRPNEDN